jgi:hypothetical protein
MRLHNREGGDDGDGRKGLAFPLLTEFGLDAAEVCVGISMKVPKSTYLPLDY